ncbi:polysaccharide deacetylase family protein [Stakelama tenebrarum]|uniref:Chitooligosaccharide deacetylase n=1 Tax=Stakelama tenebrarum TaxID=2711215 RepID=A0A6G6Y3N2_9SPHN|nr:polysaccharide deacetylase family protein [Sphingosinithalassobacter tenebrarum]QIG79510.1 polysaccharide deacetylase family protein [Sphingosinithalassobacter tenebrarum]
MAASRILERARNFVNWHVSPRVPVKGIRSRLNAPIASFTFDDVAQSAVRAGAPVLERHDARGTFYLSAALCGTRDEDGIEYFDVDDLKLLHAHGHEIGDHGFLHRPVPELSNAQLIDGIGRNRAFVREALGDVQPSAFAYPYGATSLRTKRLFSRRFASCRGTGFGLNSGLLDLAQLKVVRIDMDFAPRLDLDAVIAQCVARNAWIIFLMHDVSDTPSRFGCTGEMLERAVLSCRDAGIRIAPVRNALAQACF